MQLPATIRSRFRFAGEFTRAAEVAQVLAKYGLAAWLIQVDWEPIRNAIRSEGGDVLGQLAFEARVRLVLTDLGTTFVKLGQMLSTRPGLVGKALAAELSKLQEHTPADAPDVVQGVIERELGCPVDECFMSFDGIAMASASIGQVHRARLKTGRLVAVKVQHPDIEGTIRRDLDVLNFFAELAEKHEQLRRYRPAALVREFSRTTLNELDFRRELRNLQCFRRNFADDEAIAFPRPFPELSSGRVLTMEFVKGFPISNSKRVEKLGSDRQELARRGANAYVQMIFRDGFYHADPHPGNIFVTPDGRIGLIDAGMVGRIDDGFRKQIEDVLLAASERDAERLADSVIRMCGRPAALDRGALSTDLTEFFQEYGTQKVDAFDVGGALTAVSGILADHNLQMPGKLSMLIKCLIVLESTGHLLSPDFSLAELLEPWRRQYVRRRFSPAARLRSLRRIYLDWERTAEAIPRAAATLLEGLEKDKLVMHVEHRHLKSAANRLVVGLFISSLLIASAVLIAQHVPPLAWGVSAFGAGGYLVAVGFGLHMLWVNRDRLVSTHDSDWY